MQKAIFALIGFICLFCFGVSLYAQYQYAFGLHIKKQDNSSSTKKQQHNGKSQTRAVIIGISDYQNEGVPDLKYAHKDALVYAQYLQASKKVPAENIRLLINEQATNGQVGVEIGWLLAETQPGDSVIFYFSGHGDMEAKMINQLGFLLLWDSPPNVYTSGALSVNLLQQAVSSISVKNKAHALVIIDACRAGKLQSSDIIGRQLTNTQLRQQWVNEVKILSCQSDEFSIEGEQWGGGRGAFSYHLINGLIGQADFNKDDNVSLVEIGNYLDDHVSPEVAPLKQIPVTVGDKKSIVSYVDSTLLNQIGQRQEFQLPNFKSIQSRGLEQEVLFTADSGILQLLAAYKNAVAENRLLSPKENCADYYFNQLIKVNRISPLHPDLRRDFAAALIDEAQQVANKVLQTDPFVVSDLLSCPFVYDHVPAYLFRAMSLLGEKHFFYKHLKAKYLYFRAKTWRTDNYPDLPPDTLLQRTIEDMEAALVQDSNAAYVYVDLGLIYWFKKEAHEKALGCAQKAISLSPNWVYANYLAGRAFVLTNDSLQDYHYQRVLELDSTFLPIYQELSWVYAHRGQFEKSAHYSNKFISKVQNLLNESTNPVPVYYQTLLGAELWRSNRFIEAEAVLLKAAEASNHQDFIVYQYLKLTYFSLERYEEAILAARKQIELAPNNSEGYLILIECYRRLNQTDKAIEVAERSIERFKSSPIIDGVYILFTVLFDLYDEVKTDSNKIKSQKLSEYVINQVNDLSDPHSWFLVCLAHLKLNDLVSFQKTIETGIKIHSNNNFAIHNVAALYALANQEEKALKWLEVSIEKNKGISYFDWIKEDEDFDNIRDSVGFKALMRKHFPQEYKE